MHGGGTGRPGRACKVLEFINNWANLIIHKPCQETQERKTFRFKGFKFKRTQGQPGGPQNSLDLADAVAIQ